MQYFGKYFDAVMYWKGFPSEKVSVIKVMHKDGRRKQLKCFYMLKICLLEDLERMYCTSNIA